MSIRKSSRLGRWVKRALAGTLVTAVLAGFAVTFYIRSKYDQMGADLEAERARAGRNGLPLSAAALNRKISEDQNAAALYQEAIKALDGLPKKILSDGIHAARSLTARSQGSTPAQNGEAFEQVAKTVLPFVEKAAERPDCSFDRDWSDPITVSLPEYAKLKDFIHLLSGRAIQRSREGDAAGAAADLKRMLRISEHVGSEPTLISALVRIAGRSISRRTLEVVFSNQPARNGDELATLAQVMPGFEIDRDPLDYLKGEPYMGAYLARNIGRYSQDFGKFMGSAEDGSSENRWLKYLVVPPFQDPDRVGRAYETIILKIWNEVFELARKEKWPPDRLGRELDLRQAEAAKSDLLTKVFMGVVFSVYSQFGEVVQRDRVYCAVISAAQDVLRYRKEHGRIPAEIRLASDAIDPYSGKPMGFQVTETGFKVYSVGKDGVDNGGLEMRDSRGLEGSPKEYDEVFEVGRRLAPRSGSPIAVSAPTGR